MCVYIYIYICIYLSLSIYIYIHIVQTIILVRRQLSGSGRPAGPCERPWPLCCGPLRGALEKNIYIYICIHTYMKSTIYVCIHICLCICIYVYVCMYIYIYIYKYAYTSGLANRCPPAVGRLPLAVIRYSGGN